MKKEFSYYEFVGLLVPGCISLFAAHSIAYFIYHRTFIDFSTIGETTIFLILCYGTGHFLQAIGNLYENIIWYFYKGMPTKWLKQKNRFGHFLFEPQLNTQILQKVEDKFGNQLEDYGRLAYTKIFIEGKSGRIDIFNGNYSLYRGLSVSFFAVAIACSFYFDWKIALLTFLPPLLTTMRMVRFGKLYATEVFRVFNALL